jgi:hypothetical protein
MKTEITLVHSAGTDSKPISPASSFSKAVKGSVIIAAPEADKAKKEHRERGQVKAEVYKQYILAGGIGAFILLACLTVVGQLVNIGKKKHTQVLEVWLNSYRLDLHSQELGRA